MACGWPSLEGSVSCLGELPRARSNTHCQKCTMVGCCLRPAAAGGASPTSRAFGYAHPWPPAMEPAFATMEAPRAYPSSPAPDSRTQARPFVPVWPLPNPYRAASWVQTYGLDSDMISHHGPLAPPWLGMWIARGSYQDSYQGSYQWW